MNTSSRSKTLAATLGAALLATVLLLTGAWAIHAAPEGDALDELRDGRRAWRVDPLLRADVQARLPAAFEARALDVREHGREHFVPPLSDFALRLRGETRIGGKRMVVVAGQCSETLRPVAASAPGGPASPSPVGAGLEACTFKAAYDTDLRRFVWLSFEGVDPYDVDPIDCRDDHFQAVTRLADLPPEILFALQGPSDVADNGADFQTTDVATGQPRRRFDLAEIGDDRAFVVVEYGGMGQGHDVWLFERRDGHWVGWEHWRRGGRTDSGQAVLHQTCLGVPAPPRHDGIFASRINGIQQEDGSVWLVFPDEPRIITYVLNSPGRPRGEIVRDPPGDKPLTAEERRALRQHLLGLRRDGLPDRPEYSYVSRYLAALEHDPAAPPSAPPRGLAPASPRNPKAAPHRAGA